MPTPYTLFGSTRPTPGSQCYTLGGHTRPTIYHKGWGRRCPQLPAYDPLGGPVLCSYWQPSVRVPSSRVVDSVVEGLGPPQGVGVVKLEQVDAPAGVHVRAAVHLLVTVPPVHRDDLVGWRPVVLLGRRTALFHVTLLTVSAWRRDRQRFVY